MKSKILLSIVCLMTCSLVMLGQKKTYQGAYRLAWQISGNAQYEYNEIDFERIKDGKFTFNTQDTGSPVTYKIAITGAYKNGMKDGHWKSVSYGGKSGGYTVPRTPQNNKDAFLRKNITSQMEGQYISDQKEGKWTFSQVGSKYEYNSTAYFKNGKFYGDFIATKKIENVFFDLKGQFSENGLPDSTWIVKWNDDVGIEYVLKMEFEKGKFKSLKVVDLSNGENITSKFEKYTYVSGYYADENWGLKPEYGGSLPIIGTLIEPWVWDETLSTDENNGRMNYIFLNWNRD